MTKLIILNSKNYTDNSKNHGDCICYVYGDSILIYDCGSEEHAKNVINIIRELKIKNVVAVLSHNDSDHFNGFPYLINQGVVSTIYSQTALRYLDELEKKTGLSRDELKQRISVTYDNIRELSGYIVDIYDDNKNLKNNIFPGVNIVAPEFDYAIEVIAKALDNNESNEIDGDSVMNAASVCLNISVNNDNILLTGDSTFNNIKNNLEGLTYIQCPHHGRESQIKDLFDFYDGDDPIYLISDNTGDSNGGSDLRIFTIGRKKYCTRKEDSNIEIELGVKQRIKGTFGIK